MQLSPNAHFQASRKRCADDRSRSPAKIATMPRIPKRSRTTEVSSQQQQQAPQPLHLFGRTVAPQQLTQPFQVNTSAIDVDDANSIQLLDDANSNGGTRKFNGQTTHGISRHSATPFIGSPTPCSSSLDIHSDSDSISLISMPGSNATTAPAAFATSTMGTASDRSSSKAKKHHKKDKKRERREKSASRSSSNKLVATGASAPTAAATTFFAPFDGPNSLSSDSNTLLFGTSCLTTTTTNQATAQQAPPSLQHPLPNAAAANTSSLHPPPHQHQQQHQQPPNYTTPARGVPLRKHQSSELTFSGKFGKSTDDMIINIDSSSSSASDDEADETKRVAAVAAIASKARAFAAAATAAASSGRNASKHPNTSDRGNHHSVSSPLIRLATGTGGGDKFISRSCSPVITMDTSDDDSSSNTLGRLHAFLPSAKSSNHSMAGITSLANNASSSSVQLSGGESCSLPPSSVSLPPIMFAASSTVTSPVTAAVATVHTATSSPSTAIQHHLHHHHTTDPSAATTIHSPKKRGRKKGSNSTDRRLLTTVTTPVGGTSSNLTAAHPFATSSSLLGLKNQIDSMRGVGHSKVKTTKELLADLQSRKHDATDGSSPPPTLLLATSSAASSPALSRSHGGASQSSSGQFF